MLLQPVTLLPATFADLVQNGLCEGCLEQQMLKLIKAVLMWELSPGSVIPKVCVLLGTAWLATWGWHLWYLC